MYLLEDGLRLNERVKGSWIRVYHIWSFTFVNMGSMLVLKTLTLLKVVWVCRKGFRCLPSHDTWGVFLEMRSFLRWVMSSSTLWICMTICMDMLPWIREFSNQEKLPTHHVWLMIHATFTFKLKNIPTLKSCYEAWNFIT